MKLVSFYTKNYVNYANQLRAECNRLNQEHLILERDYGSNWIDNVRAKPRFLLEMVDKLRSDFVWLDVDSHILKPIDFVLNNWGVMLREDKTPHDFVHYIPYKPETIKFLMLWTVTIGITQKGSHTAFLKIANDYTVLPDGYFQIGISNNESKTAYFHSHS